MLVTPLHQPPRGQEIIKDYGLVSGCAVVSRMELFDQIADLSSLVGGHIGSYEKMVRTALASIYAAIQEAASEVNTEANAVMAVQVSSSPMGKDMLEVIFIGSAVRVETVE